MWMLKRVCTVSVVLVALMLGSGNATAEPVYYFSVLNQRSPILTAQYWNPILAYISRRSGVELRLKMGKTALETTALTMRGEAQFAYTNHLFPPDRVKLKWRVIARPDTDGIRGQIVVPTGSSVMSLEDLNGQSVAFPSPEAFVGYKLPMDALLRRGVRVTPVFSGNQEGAMGQLRAGRVAAAGVSEDVMTAFGARERFQYRVVWNSDEFKDLPIMVSPVVPEDHVQSVAKAFGHMRSDPEGWRILVAGAELLRLERPVGFMVSSDREYANYRNFYRSTVLR